VEGHVAAAGRRRKEFGLPQVEIMIREVWLPGPDPAGVSPVVEGCHLDAHSWHAQFDPAGARWQLSGSTSTAANQGVSGFIAIRSVSRMRSRRRLATGPCLSGCTRSNG
jgi:hypothetical protein